MSDSIDFQPISATPPPSNIDFQPIDETPTIVKKGPGVISKFLFGDPNSQVNDLDISNPLTTISDAAKKAGGYIAEKGGEIFPNHPNIAAGVGTAVSVLPDLGMMMSGPSALKASTNPIARGLMNTPEELGPEFQSGAEDAGISGNLPEQRGAVARFPQPERIVPTPQPKPMTPAQTLPSVPPTSYPRDPSALVNFAKTRMDTFGDKLSPQELSDYKTMLGNVLDKSFNPNSPAGAIATQVKNQASELLNNAIPGRAGLNQAYGISKATNPDWGSMASYLVKKIGWLPVQIALGQAGVKGLADLFDSNR